MADAAQLKNTRRNYGIVAIAFHWIVALGFMANYAIIYYREWFTQPRTDINTSLILNHFAIGVSVLVFVILRVLWRWVNVKPDPLPAPRLQTVVGRAVHTLLYIAVVAIPLTGYLGTGAPSKLFFFIDVPAFKTTAIFHTVVEGWMGLSYEAFEKPIDFIHKTGGEYIVSALIVIHIAAALYHHFIVKDATLKRMVSPQSDA